MIKAIDNVFCITKNSFKNMKSSKLFFFYCFFLITFICSGQTQKKKTQYFKDFDYFTLEGINEVNWWKKGKIYIKVKHKTDSTFTMIVHFRKVIGGFRKSKSEVLKTKEKIISIRKNGGCMHLLGGCYIDTTYHFPNRVICFKKSGDIFVHLVEKLDENHFELIGDHVHSVDRNKEKEYISGKSNPIPEIESSGWVFELSMTKTQSGYHMIKKTQSGIDEYDRNMISLFWFLYNTSMTVSPVWR